jgi:hypothetical protein
LRQLSVAQRTLELRGGGDEPKADEEKGREKIERDKALIGELQAMRIACRWTSRFLL